MTGYDQDLAPMGSSFPTLLLGIKRINPDNDQARLSLADSSNYTRINGEIVFRTPISSSSYFEANIRYYKELSPSAAIKNAKLDEHIYFTAALTKSDGMFVSYTTGKLPFDAKNDQIYQLGFKYNF